MGYVRGSHGPLLGGLAGPFQEGESLYNRRITHEPPALKAPAFIRRPTPFHEVHLGIQKVSRKREMKGSGKKKTPSPPPRDQAPVHTCTSDRILGRPKSCPPETMENKGKGTSPSALFSSSEEIVSMKSVVSRSQAAEAQGPAGLRRGISHPRCCVCTRFAERCAPVMTRRARHP